MSSSRRFRRRLEPQPQPGTWPPGDTKTTLVRDLEAKPADPVRDQIIKRAKAGHYHDFDTSLATPKVTLYKHLLSAGFPDLAQKVKDGAYDDERPTLEQQEELRADLGPAGYDALMGGKPRGQA